MPCYETALAAYQAENWAQAFALLQRGAAAAKPCSGIAAPSAQATHPPSAI